MKDSRKLSLIYFAISMVLLLFVCFGCERNSVDYIHSFNGYEVYYADSDNPEYVEKVKNKIKIHNDNFVLQSEIGIIEVEDGEIIYNNVK